MGRGCARTRSHRAIRQSVRDNYPHPGKLSHGQSNLDPDLDLDRLRYEHANNNGHTHTLPNRSFHNQLHTCGHRHNRPYSLLSAIH